MNDDPLIRCQNLTKVYRKGTIEVTPLANLTLEVPRGEFLGLMGPSGSGKTTLLNLISGIDRPTSGTLWVGDREFSKMSRGQLTKWRSTECGYIFQLYHLVPILSAFENVELPLLLQKRLSRKARRIKVEAALELVGLADRSDHRPSELSGGQEQRVAIARALVADPALLVADEPTGDLDRESADQILKLLSELASVHQKTIVMVTHDARAAEVADRTLHLEKGKLVESRGGVVV
jgi:putative ABC transport system ATP-binding protein